MNQERRKVILGLSTLTATAILPSQAFASIREPILTPGEKTRIEGFNVVNNSSRSVYIPEMIVEEMSNLRNIATKIRIQKDSLNRDFSDRSDKMPFEYLTTPNLVLYANIFGEPHPERKSVQRGTFEQNLEAYKRWSGFNDLAHGILKFYKKNEATLLQQQQKVGVPAPYIAALMGRESSFGNVTGNYPFIGTAFSHYLRTKDGEFWKKDFARQELLAGKKMFDIHGIKLEDAKSSEGLAAGPGQTLSSNYFNGRFISSSGQQPNIFSLEDSIFSAGNHLCIDGWPVELEGPIVRDDPRYVALQKYNGCDKYPEGSFKRFYYPEFIIDLTKVLEAKLK